ncbi:MAG: vWA domain-containing protein [Planctomycetota bacterium]|jgi:hypothetical protein
MSRDPGRLQAKVEELQETIERMELQRELERRRRLRNLLLLGVSLSLVAHISLMLYLNLFRRSVPPGPGPQPVSIEFAMIQEAELTQLESLQFDDLVPEVPLDDAELFETDMALELADDVSSAALDISASGAVPALTGAGRGQGSTLGGGGAGTSFFGVTSHGTRFAYIVDVSGSMGQQRKMEVAMRELARSIEALPDYAFFYVVLYASGITLPPSQGDWTRARPSSITRLIRWLNQIDPRGGTRPTPAFKQVFSVEERPDVIFFLTDGEIPRAEEVLATVTMLNSRGRMVVINTIAFGDPSSQDLLREIARRSGGIYRFVPSDAW